MKKLLIVGLFLWVGDISLAQQKKYLDNEYKKAEEYFKRGWFKEFRHSINDILETDPSYYDAYLLLTEYFLVFQDYDSLKWYLEQCVQHCQSKHPDILFTYANVLYESGDINKALAIYEKYKKQNIPANQLKIVNNQIERCNYALDLMAHPVNFNPVNMGDGVNSDCDEYYPYISPDEHIMVFTRKVPKYYNASPASDDTQEDFYISTFDNGVWTKAKPLSGKVNTFRNEGAQTITADGRYMVFTACNRDDGKGSCDLYYSELTPEGWSTPKNLFNINTSAWESQPSISADGKELYFASERPDGYGNSDIYVSYRNADGSWSRPQILDTTINTPFAETSPFIHPDGKTLYFCSNGHKGVGGFDIFITQKNENGKWTTPKNLGYPINTPQNDIGLVVSASGKHAYICSNRKGGYGLIDIYRFDLPEPLQPEKMIYIKGKVFDEESNKPVKATCEIINLQNQKVIFSTQSDSLTGEFILCLPQKEEYGLYITSNKYLFYSQNIKAETIEEGIINDIYLKPVKKGSYIVLPNIFFEVDSFKLKTISIVELNKIIAFLNEHPDIKVEISGHTDNTGNEQYNLSLSEKRAKSVYEYLIKNGIKAERLKYKGYGSTKPRASNETEEGRALNRRTELSIY